MSRWRARSNSSWNGLALKWCDSQFLDKVNKSRNLAAKSRTASAPDNLWSPNFLCTYLGMSLILVPSGSSWNRPVPMLSASQFLIVMVARYIFFYFADFDIIFRVHYMHGMKVSAKFRLWGVGCSVGYFGYTITLLRKSNRSSIFLLST